MTDQTAGSGGPRWLREPPPGGADIHVAIGTGAELTPELREAVEALASALQQDEVEGYRTRNCPNYGICNPLGNCNPDQTWPCAIFSSCRISE
jgi:hypothetical protein